MRGRCRKNVFAVSVAFATSVKLFSFAILGKVLVTALGVPDVAGVPWPMDKRRLC